MFEFNELIISLRIALYIAFFLLMIVFIAYCLYRREKIQIDALVKSRDEWLEKCQHQDKLMRELRDANQRLNSKLNSSKARLRRAKKASKRKEDNHV